MITAGVDVGSLSTNAVLLDGTDIIASETIRTGPDGVKAAWTVLNNAMAKAQINREINVQLNDLVRIVATGYGRVRVPFSHKVVTEIACHARGNQWSLPEVRTILDMGGQDCKVIRCNSEGRVINFEMNDKCAAGTGRYLERIAATLGISLNEFGPMSLKPVEGPATITSICAVYAQRDILVLLRKGTAQNDILAGACRAIIDRIQPMLDRVGVEEAFVVSGGVAKNGGVVSWLEKRLGISVHVPEDPQIMGALGAALFAQDIVSGKNPDRSRQTSATRRQKNCQED